MHRGKLFLQAHWDGQAATDLITVEVLTLEGLKRYLVLFVIDLRTRYVHAVGIHRSATGRGWSRCRRKLTGPGEELPARPHGICFTTAIPSVTPMTSR